MLIYLFIMVKIYSKIGHSCLIPITECAIKVLYVFVEISIDLNHFCETVKLNFES